MLMSADPVFKLNVKVLVWQEVNKTLKTITFELFYGEKYGHKQIFKHRFFIITQ